MSLFSHQIPDLLHLGFFDRHCLDIWSDVCQSVLHKNLSKPPTPEPAGGKMGVADARIIDLEEQNAHLE